MSVAKPISAKRSDDELPAQFPSRGELFFTVNLADRRLRLLTDHIGELRSAFRETRTRHAFTIDAIVVLPDHLHAIWTLPDGDADFALRWRPHQVSLFAHLAARRAALAEPRRKGRTWHLAAALLGAHVA